MEGGEGMVAFVRSLNNSGLAVTLLDSGNQYTLMPSKDDGRKEKNSSIGVEAGANSRRDTSTQVTDGQYASTYRMCHCNVKPTSPPIELTEFPLQRAEFKSGQGNFLVGGLGSGEVYPVYPARRNSITSNDNRNWSTWGPQDPISPHSSQDRCPFADSLRKYPNLSSNSTSSYRHCVTPFTRPYDKAYCQSFGIDNRHRRFGRWESPTRDRPDVTGDRYRNEPYRTRRDSPVRDNLPRKLMVNSAVQAAASKVSRDITTTPIPKPVTRSVAVSQFSSPSTSKHTGSLDEPSMQTEKQKTITCQKPTEQIVKTKHIHSSASSIDVEAPIRIDVRKSFSEVLLKRTVKEYEIDLKELLDEVNLSGDGIPKPKDDNVLKAAKSLARKHFGRRVRVKVCHDLNSDREVVREKFYNEIMGVQDLNAFNVTTYTALAGPKINSEKASDNLDTTDQKSEVLGTMMKRSNRFFINRQRHADRVQFKSDILDILKDVRAKAVKNNGHRIGDIFVNILHKVVITENRNRHYQKIKSSQYINKIDDKDLKLLLSNATRNFLIELNLNLKPIVVKIIENKLHEIINSNFKSHDRNGYVLIQNKIHNFLYENGFSKKQADNFTTIILNNLKKYLENKKPKMFNSQSYIICNISKSNEDTQRNVTNKSISAITQEDINANLNAYLSQVIKEIDEWLASLNITQPQNKQYRDEVINDLANDIIDRQKYLQLDLSGPVSEEEELEHFKYQIFKWIKKVIGEDKLETIQRAPDLLRRLNSLPIPMLKKPANGRAVPQPVFTNNTDFPSKQDQVKPTAPMASNLIFNNSFSKNNTKKKSITKVSGAGPSGAIIGVNQSFICSNGFSDHSLRPGTTNTQRDQDNDLSRLVSNNNNTIGENAAPLIHVLNQKFDEYLTNWVEEVPISVSSNDELVLAEKARLGLRNGIIKAVIIMTQNPAFTYNNYHQDLLDREVETLLSYLPQTAELLAKKPLLKSKVLNTAKEIYDQFNASESYKSKLLKKIKDLISSKVVKVPDSQDFIEDYLFINIVENYIMSKNYEEIDKLKAENYTKKVGKETKEMFEEMKRSKCLENEQMSYEDFDKIVATLNNVPKPSEQAIKNEVDEITLGFEIENWCTDLPLKANNDRVLMLQRRRLRNDLTQKVLMLQPNQSIEKEIKIEVSRFLPTVSLEANESLNMNLMVEELVDRINNLRMDKRRVSRRLVTFQEPIYQEFAKNLPPCCHSSFANATPGQGWPSNNFQAFSGFNNISSLGPDHLALNTTVENPEDYQAFDMNRLKSSTFHQENVEPFHFTSYSNQPPRHSQIGPNFSTQQPYFNTFIPGQNPRDLTSSGQMYFPDSQNQFFHQNQSMGMSQRQQSQGPVGYIDGAGRSNQSSIRSQRRNSPNASTLSGIVGSTLHEPSSYLNQFGFTTLPPQDPNQPNLERPACCQIPNIQEQIANGTANQSMRSNHPNTSNLQNIPPQQYQPREDPDLVSLMTDASRYRNNAPVYRPPVPPHFVMIPQTNDPHSFVGSTSQYQPQDPNFVTPERFLEPAPSVHYSQLQDGEIAPQLFTPIIQVPPQTSEADQDRIALPLQPRNIEGSSNAQRSVAIQASTAEAITNPSFRPRTVGTSTSIDMNRTPIYSSTPNPPQLPRKKPRQTSRQDLETVARQLDYSDSDEDLQNNEESQRCRCFRSKGKNRRGHPFLRNKDCEIDPYMPFWYPMRYPCPYYY